MHNLSRTAILVGIVDAPDAETAIGRAIVEEDVPEYHWAG